MLNSRFSCADRSWIAVLAIVLLSVSIGPSASGQVAVSLSGFEGTPGSVINVAVELGNVEGTSSFSSFAFEVVLDTPGVEFLGHEKAGTLSAKGGWAVNSSTTSNKVGGFASSSNAITSSGTLIILKFQLHNVAEGATVTLKNFALALSATFLVYTPAVPSASISAQNGPPAALPASKETNEETSVDIQLQGFDPEGSPLTYSIIRFPDHGDLSLLGSLATYEPELDFFGTDTFQFVVNDGTTDSDAATITLFVLPVNDVPSSPTLQTPIDFATIPVAGNPNDAIQFSWFSSSDVDDDPLTYEWQLSRNLAFTEVLLSVPTGSAISHQLSIGALGDFLNDENVQVGASLSAYHRAVVTDGSLEVEGQPHQVTFERGLITGTVDQTEIPARLVLSAVYPNPSHSFVNVRYAVPTSSEVLVGIYDVLGREVISGIRSSVQAGTYTLYLRVADLAPGVYYVRIEHDGQSISKPLTIER